MVETQNMAAEPGQLRVLHIASGDLWAGAEVQVSQLLRAAQRLDDVDVHAVVLNPGQLADRLSADDVPVTVLDESRQSFVAIASALRGLCRHWRPAVIHTHRRKEHLLGALAAHACDAALVGTVHGRDELTSSGLDARQRLLRGIERIVLTRAHDRLVAVSDDLADDLPGGRSHAVVIPNSIDVATVRGAAEARLNRCFVSGGRVHLGFLGRLVPVKQIDHLLQMMLFLESERPGRFMLNIIGDGPLMDHLRGTAAGFGIERSIALHGFQANPLRLLAQMQVLLFASAHEGLPMAALESLALGVPVVAPPLPSLQRLIHESGAGKVARSDTPRDLADAVLALGLQPNDLEGLRSSVLPARYHLQQGLYSTVLLWQQEARRPSP